MRRLEWIRVTNRCYWNCSDYSANMNLAVECDSTTTPSYISDNCSESPADSWMCRAGRRQLPPRTGRPISLHIVPRGDITCSTPNRREFLQAAGLLAASSALLSPRSVFAANDTIHIACIGRGRPLPQVDGGRFGTFRASRSRRSATSGITRWDSPNHWPMRKRLFRRTGRWSWTTRASMLWSLAPRTIGMLR